MSGIPLGLGFASVTLSNGSLVATVTPLPGVGYRLDGQLVGRIATRSILTLLATVKDPLDDTQFLCGDDPTFQSFFMGFCASADIMSDPSFDNTNQSCDSLSAAFGFVAISARLGAEYPGKAPVIGCDGSVQDCPR
jgi:hypothetical protein